jgi:hypothetical protein
VPLVSGTYGELLTSAVVLAYGILWEKYFVSWPSGVFNALSFIVLLVTVDLPAQVFALLAVYVGFTFLAIHYNWRDFFVLVGSKTYGSLTLTIALEKLGYLASLSQYLYTNAGPGYANETGTIVVGWILTAIAVHIVGAIYARATRHQSHHRGRWR